LLSEFQLIPKGAKQISEIKAGILILVIMPKLLINRANIPKSITEKVSRGKKSL